MNLEEINKKYLQEKNALLKKEKLKESIKQLEKDLVISKREREDAMIKKIRAEQDQDNDAKEQAVQELKDAEKKIQEIQGKILKAKITIEKNQKMVDSYINEIYEEPEMKEHLDNIKKQRFVRKLKKLTKEQEDINKFKKLIDDHPSFEKQIVGMKNAIDEKKELEEELKGLDLSKKKDQARKAEIENVLIPELDGKYANNKAIIMSTINKEKLGIDEKYLEEFVNSDLSKTKDGKINLNKTLKNRVKSNEKQIDTYNQALSKVMGRPVVYTPETQQGDSSSSTTPTRDTEGEESTNLPIVSEQPKWYQFIKRFKNWRQSKAEQSEETEQNVTREQVEESLNEDKKTPKSIRDSLKYEVVKDALEIEEHDILREAKKARKANEEKEEEQEQEQEL